MDRPRRVVTDSMIGIKLPNYARYSPRVAFVLGQNPGMFTGPGTNTYLVGTSRRPLLLDTGAGVASYADILVEGVAELSHSRELDKIVATHGHADHIGGVRQIRERFGEVEVMKKPWPERDAALKATPDKVLEAGDEVATEGATLKAVFTPGHAPDHLCYYLIEERALFTGDVVLGAGTTVIPEEGGDLGLYLDSLKRLLELDLETIYPAHGPVIRNPEQKIREYIAHRELRENQVLDALKLGPQDVMAIVKKIYTDVPESLHQAAASSIRSHLKKLRKEGAVTELQDQWTLR
ncbi:MAG TPA: MBL fold metallo-hydrolase [Candidatus Binataceae bacterium]|nr:MBL fold metallo-hydrolase [Candidatus Binataceae bacterium]